MFWRWSGDSKEITIMSKTLLFQTWFLCNCVTVNAEKLNGETF